MSKRVRFEEKKFEMGFGYTLQLPSESVTVSLRRPPKRSRARRRGSARARLEAHVRRDTVRPLPGKPRMRWRDAMARCAPGTRTFYSR